MSQPARQPRNDAPPPPGSDESTLADLIARVAERDEAAFTRLYDLTRRRVFGLALAIARDDHAADEATLDVYTQVWRRAGTFDPSRGDAWTWMLAMARTRCLDVLRARTRQFARQEPLAVCADKACGAVAPEGLCLGAESARTVREAVSKLPPSQREAIETAYFGGLSYSEAATALGVPVGTVKTRIRAALAGLRTTLYRFEGDPR